MTNGYISLDRLVVQEREAARALLMIQLAEMILDPAKALAFTKDMEENNTEKELKRYKWYHAVARISELQQTSIVGEEQFKAWGYPKAAIIHLAKTLNRPEAVIEAINSHISSGAEDDVIFHILRTVNKLYRTAEDFREYKYNTEKEIRTYHKIVENLNVFNSEYKKRNAKLLDELGQLKEDIKKAIAHEAFMTNRVSELEEKLYELKGGLGFEVSTPRKVSDMERPMIEDAVVEANTKASAECCKKHEELAFRVVRYCEDFSHLKGSIKAATPSNRYARAELGIMVAIRKLHSSYRAKHEEKIETDNFPAVLEPGEHFTIEEAQAYNDEADRLNAEDENTPTEQIIEEMNKPGSTFDRSDLDDEDQEDETEIEERRIRKQKIRERNLAKMSAVTTDDKE